MSSSPDVRSLLLSAGEKLPAEVRAGIIERGAAAVPELAAIVADEDLLTLDAPGEGWAPIHAAGLLGELRAVEAAPTMARVLRQAHLEDILYSVLIGALARTGPEVAPAVLDVLATSSGEERSGLLEVLAQCGARDERIYRELLAFLHEDVEFGPGLLSQYGDARAVGPLLLAFDAYQLGDEEGLFAHQPLVELADAIRELGGDLGPEREAKCALVGKARRSSHWGRRPEQVLARRVERPERNAPCWCGSGKKYKKCHLAADEGLG
jgi:SEC-C motif